MDRIKYPLNHEWHVALNRFRPHDEDWKRISWMYEAKTMADEVPRMVMLFKQEREATLPQTHQQCSQQAPVPLKENHLTCCLGVKTAECPYLRTLEKIERCTPEDIDTAKAWTCAVHISSEGGDHMGEGFLQTVGDRLFWRNVYDSLSQDEDSAG